MKFNLSLFTYGVMLLASMHVSLNAHTQDTTRGKMPVIRDSVLPSTSLYQFNLKKLVIPSVLISYGVVSFAMPSIKTLDLSTRQEILKEKTKGTTWDNFTQVVPTGIVYGLNLVGIKGEHDFMDRSIIYATSQAVLAAAVFPSKSFIGRMRPDSSNSFSFPSGHAAIAFSSAHFLFREYRDVSFWIAISGYPFAVFTSKYRVINNKHWVSDVVAGAGIGILATEAGYWLYPAISSLFHQRKKKKPAVILPFYQQKSIGLTLVKKL